MGIKGTEIKNFAKFIQKSRVLSNILRKKIVENISARYLNCGNKNDKIVVDTLNCREEASAWITSWMDLTQSHSLAFSTAGWMYCNKGVLKKTCDQLKFLENKETFFHANFDIFATSAASYKKKEQSK